MLSKKCSAVVGFALGERFPLFLAGRCGLISAVPSGCRDLPADAHQRHPPELDLMPVRLPFDIDATSKRRKENQCRSATALQHNSSLAAEKGKYGALDPSQFVAHLELVKLELTQHKGKAQ
jgi:hypothetical protein